MYLDEEVYFLLLAPLVFVGIVVLLMSGAVFLGDENGPDIKQCKEWRKDNKTTGTDAGSKITYSDDCCKVTLYPPIDKPYTVKLCD